MFLRLLIINKGSTLSLWIQEDLVEFNDLFHKRLEEGLTGKGVPPQASCRHPALREFFSGILEEVLITATLPRAQQETKKRKKPK